MHAVKRTERDVGVQVSVVIPTRNRRALLQKAVDSVVASSVPSWELIIIDDASSDGTFAWLSGLTDERIRVVRSPIRIERSKARNLGLRLAGAPYICFLDDDDELCIDTLGRLSRRMSRHRDICAAIGRFVEVSSGKELLEPRILPWHRKKRIWPELLSGWSAVPSQVMFRRSAIAAVGGWSTAYRSAEDHELWTRLGTRYKVLFLNDVVCRKRRHPGQWRPRDTMANRDQIIFSAAQAAGVRMQRRYGSLLKLRLTIAKCAVLLGAGYRLRAFRCLIAIIWSLPKLISSPVLFRDGALSLQRLLRAALPTRRRGHLPYRTFGHDSEIQVLDVPGRIL